MAGQLMEVGLPVEWDLGSSTVGPRDDDEAPQPLKESLWHPLPTP